MGEIDIQPVSAYLDASFVLVKTVLLAGWVLALSGIATWFAMAGRWKMSAGPALAWFAKIMLILQITTLCAQLAILGLSLYDFRKDVVPLAILFLVVVVPSGISLLSWQRVRRRCRGGVTS